MLCQTTILDLIAENREMAIFIGVASFFLLLFFILFLRSLFGGSKNTDELPEQTNAGDDQVQRVRVVEDKITFDENFLNKLREVTDDAQTVLTHFRKEIESKEQELLNKQRSLELIEQRLEREQQGEEVSIEEQEAGSKSGFSAFAIGLSLGLLTGGGGAVLYFVFFK